MTDARTLQRQIHLACRQLGLDADTRHALQARVTGKASLTEMSMGELRAVVNALENQGFKPGFTPGQKPRHPRAPRADLRYIHALWKELSRAGAVEKPGREGLNAFIRRFEGHWGSVPIDIDALRDSGQINDVIRALQAICRRHGLEVEQ